MLDYFALVRSGLEDPTTALTSAIDSGEALAVAIVHAVDPLVGEPTRVERITQLVGRGHPKELNGDLCLGILGTAPEGELTAAADKLITQHVRDWSFTSTNLDFVVGLIRDTSKPANRRRLLLIWLSWAYYKQALKTAKALISDASMRFDEVAQVALNVLGRQADITLIVEYAKRQVASEISEGDAPHDANGTLHAIDRAQHLGDPATISDLLEEVARANHPVGERLDRFVKRIEFRAFLRVAQALCESGHGAWVARELVPPAAKIRPRELAKSTSFGGWSRECVDAICTISWQSNPELYAELISGTASRGEDDLRSTVTRLAGDVITQLEAGHKARAVVAAACFKLCLAGLVEPTDEQTLEIVGFLTSDEVKVMFASVGWKSRGRAERVAMLIQAAGRTLTDSVLSELEAPGDKVWLGLIDGTTAAALDGQAEGLVEALADRDEPLVALCEKSGGVADEVLAVWHSTDNIKSFRALSSSKHSEERLACIPDVVRKYDSCNSGDRIELIMALDGRPEQLEAVAGILRDFIASPRPSADDLCRALGVLGNLLALGAPIDDVIETLAEICRQSRNNDVRRGAYETLGDATPTDVVVDLLLARSEAEVPAMRAVVRDALDSAAAKLDAIAGTTDALGRSHAVQQLARIDSKRALPHARDLLTADPVDDRLIGAVILGEHGEPESDAAQLKTAAENEPEKKVRKQMERASRRLEVGDAFDAHIRIGELAKLPNLGVWDEYDPVAIWGQWTAVLVKGLNELSKAEADEAYGRAIDALDELAKVVFFRTVQVVGNEIGIKPQTIAKVANNNQDYGGILHTQHIITNWKWVASLATLHEKRTAHLAKKGKTEPIPDPDSDDLDFAYNLFAVGVRDCAVLLERASGTPRA